MYTYMHIYTHYYSLSQLHSTHSTNVYNQILSRPRHPPCYHYCSWNYNSIYLLVHIYIDLTTNTIASSLWESIITRQVVHANSPENKACRNKHCAKEEYMCIRGRSLHAITYAEFQVVATIILPIATGTRTCTCRVLRHAQKRQCMPPKYPTPPQVVCTCSKRSWHMLLYVHVREIKEGRKEGRSKQDQTNKAKQNSTHVHVQVGVIHYGWSTETSGRIIIETMYMLLASFFLPSHLSLKHVYTRDWNISSELFMILGNLWTLSVARFDMFEVQGENRTRETFFHVPNDLKNVLEVLNISRFVYRKTLVFNAAVSLRVGPTFFMLSI